MPGSCAVSIGAYLIEFELPSYLSCNRARSNEIDISIDLMSRPDKITGSDNPGTLKDRA
jgi:hypothetical protein